MSAVHAAKGVGLECASAWWLRSPNDNNDNALAGWSDGANNDNNNVEYPAVAVRPDLFQSLKRASRRRPSVQGIKEPDSCLVGVCAACRRERDEYRPQWPGRLQRAFAAFPRGRDATRRLAVCVELLPAVALRPPRAVFMWNRPHKAGGGYYSTITKPVYCTSPRTPL
jgi:hypothetical protein